jgi:glyoxylase-like metal-dependent hydrolase (beta-lactamase superfamily II)
VTGPEELAPGLWRWTARHPEWHPGEFGREVACYALRTDGGTLLVDPLVPEPLAEAIDGIVAGRVAILITIPYHARSAEPLATRYGAVVHGHPAVAKRFARPAAVWPAAPGDELPGGARAFSIGRPRRYEQPLWLPSHRALAFGDAVVEHDGALRVWAQGPRGEHHRRFLRERFAPTLHPLLELEPERVLVTHGRPVLSRGGPALAAALEAEPFWLGG